MLQFLRVAGESLAPEYREGDFVLIVKIPFFLNRLAEDDIIAFRHPDYGLMIKKIAVIEPGQDRMFVIGTHDNSIDSRHFGTIRRSDLVGKVIWHLRKPDKTR
ncbi:MAG: S24/S26 family peptidase [Anaerolineales bacterium]